MRGFVGKARGKDGSVGDAVSIAGWRYTWAGACCKNPEARGVWTSSSGSPEASGEWWIDGAGNRSGEG